MGKSWQIALACFLGAFVGTLAALDISTRFEYGSYLWGAGALLGGIVAYIAVDFRHFCAGVARSHRSTIAWRPYGLYWKALGMMYLGLMSLSSTASLIPYSLLFLNMTLEETRTLAITGVLIVVFFSMAVSLPLALIMGQGDSTAEQYELALLRFREFGYDMLFKMNPVSVPYYVLRGLWWLLISLPRVVVSISMFIMASAVTTAHFVTEVFVYIHSRRRALCFADAALGAAMGYSFNNTLVGGVAGAFLGIIGYKLVAVGWLKLAP